MSKNPGHQPQRFHQYIELEDKSGFKLDGNSFVFIYDKYGGWEDQYGNYYNADGKPDEGPDSSESSSGGSWSDYSQQEDDEYEKQFGPSWEVQDYFQQQTHQSQKILQKIAANNVLLQQHDKNSPLRVDFQILDIKQDEDEPLIADIIKAIRKKKVDIINAFYNKDLKDFVGGYLVPRDLKAATRLIHLQGDNICHFDFTFDVESFKQLQVQPLDEIELQQFEGQKKFISLKQGQVVRIFGIDGGLSCPKKQFTKWLQSLGINKKDFQMIKIKKQGKNKHPVLKLKQTDIEKIEGKQLNGKKVHLQIYQSKAIKEQDEEEQVEKKQETAQKTQQKKQEPKQ